MSDIKALIFDMDGTIVDNMPFHIKAWLQFLKKHDIYLRSEEFKSKNHGNLDEIIRRIFGPNLPETMVKTLGQEKEIIYRNIYKNHIREIKGLTNLLNTLKAKGIKAAMATMGDQPNIDFILDNLGIRSFFHSITGGHEVKKGKPEPEIFELVLKKLNLANHDCVVIEDSTGGVKAALKSGLKVIGITTTHTKEELINSGCYFTISDFTEIDPDRI